MTRLNSFRTPLEKEANSIEMMRNVQKSDNNESRINNPRSYAQTAARNGPLSKREYAITIDCIPGIKQKDYLSAVANLIDPLTIRFASRISLNRYCIHFTGKEIVDEFLKNHKAIKIGEHEISVRRLVNPSKRIIASNVCPTISNEVIEEFLKCAGIRLTSRVSCLRASHPDPKLKHVLSYRRQVYIVADDLSKLPEAAVITNEGQTRKVFFHEDVIVCYLCKNPGHIAVDCPDNDATEHILDKLAQEQVIQELDSLNSISKVLSVVSEVNKEPDISQPLQIFGKKQSSDIINTKDSFPNLINEALPRGQTVPNLKNIEKAGESAPLYTTLPNQTAIKEAVESAPLYTTLPNQTAIKEAGRISPCPPTLSKTADSKKRLPTFVNDSPFTKACAPIIIDTPTSKKKTKKEKPENKIETLLKENISLFSENYPIGFKQFVKLLEMAKGHYDAIELTDQFTENKKSLITMLTEIRQNTKHRIIKTRCFSLLKRLKNKFIDDILIGSSDSSDDSEVNN